MVRLVSLENETLEEEVKPYRSVRQIGNCQLYVLFHIPSCGWKNQILGFQYAQTKMTRTICTSPLKTDNRKKRPPMVELKKLP